MTQAVAEQEPAPVLRNITPFDEIVMEIDDLYAEAGNWADGSPVESQEQCDELDRLDKLLLDAGKRLDALRVEEKRPLDEQVQAIQDRYNPYIQPKKGRVDLARSSLNAPRAAWKAKLLAEKLEREERARREAEEERRKAEEMMRASAGNLAAREAAEEQLELAKEAEAFAKREAKRATTGNGLRTSYEIEVSDLNAAIRHYWSIRRDDFSELVQSLATEDVRRGIREIPGVTITEIKKAI